MNNPNGTRAVGTSAGEASMGLPWYSELALPVLAVDPDSFVVLWNQSLAEISGIDSPLKRRHDASENSSAATAPLPLANLLASHSQTVWSEALQTALAKGRAKCAIDLHGPTAATSFIATLATKQGTTNGELPFVVCFLEEQTSSPPAPPKTIASDESSTVISLQSLSMPVWGIDLNGKVSFWSNAMAALVGLEPNEAAESDLEHLVALADLPAVRHTLNEAMHGKSTSGLGFALQLNASSQKQQQTQKPVRLVSCVIPWRAASSDQIVGALVMGRPVSIHDETAHEWGRMIQTALAPIFGVDCKGRINEWNDFMAETTGFSAKEALQLNFIDTFVESDRREDVDVFLRDALQGNGSDTVEIEIRSRTGTVRSLLLSMSPRRNQSDEIIGVVFFARDTTESAKRDRAIAAIAAELRRLIDTANAPIFGIDYDGYVNEWNDKTAEITGYAKGEALGCSLVDSFVATQMRDSAREVLENAKQGFGTSNYELEFCTKSNDIRDLLVNVTARRDEHGHVVGVLIVAQDVTESVQRDRAVAGMALELRQLIDTANAPIFGIDADGNINEWNRRTQEITGYSKEETFDEPLVERFIAPSERKKVQEILDAALQGNETSNYEIEFISKSGEPRFMLVNATTRRDPESNVVGVVGVGQDVTEDRKYVEEIRKMHYIQATQEVKVETERNMTAYFAHELRNPLSAVDSALNSMPEDLPDSAKSLIAGMQLCTSFMSSVMNNLLDVRKMEEGMLTLTKSPLSLSSTLSNVHKMLLPSVKPGVEFTAASDTRERDWVYGDEHRLQQVMTNVVTNAIKYTLTGTIKISIGWRGDLVRFECADTGPGIPKKEQQKLFERFVQRGGAPGTGLGLAIAKNIVKLAGGRIHFESDPSIKPGTTCVVQLPLLLCESKENPKPDNVPDEKLLEDELRFLIIDDVKMNRMMLSKRILKGIAPNATISEASTGEEALVICGNETFDVIVVDQFMEEAGGVMVGTDVVYAMRRMRIESIIIGCSGNDLSQEFTEAGADWVWQKPMPSNREIITHLRQAMEKNSRTRQGSTDA